MATVKRRWRGSGRPHGNARLDLYSIRHIRQMMGRISSRELAKAYNIGKTTVLDIWHGRTWGDL